MGSKTLITAVVCFLLFKTNAQINYVPIGGQKFNNIAQLKAQIAIHNAVVYVLGRDSSNDGLGGNYRYDTASVATGDDYNIVQPTGITTGRWMRTNQTMSSYAQGTLLKIGPIKIFTGTTTTGANGEATVNLTTDNTSNGTAIFTTIYYADALVERNSNNAYDVTNGDVKTIGASNKTVTYKFSSGLVLSLLGATLSIAPTGLTVRYFVLGN